MAKRRLKGEGSIVKLANGKYKVTLTIGRVNGKQKRTSCTGTKRECLQFIKSVNSSKRGGEYRKLSESFEEYMEVISVKYRPSTLRSIKSYFHVITSLIDEPVNKINNTHVNIIEKHYKHSPQSSNIALGYLNRVIDYEVKLGTLERNPLIITRQKVPPKKIKNIQPIPPKKKIKVLEDILNLGDLVSERDRLITHYIVMLGMYCGLRIGESHALTSEDIDLENNIINIYKTCSYNVIEDGTKSTRGYRSIGVDRPILEDALAFLIRAEKEPHIFKQTRSGKALTSSEVSTIVSKTLSKAGYGELTSHSFRHDFISTALTDNNSIALVSQYVGHKTISTTYKVYTHLNLSQPLIKK